VYLTHPKASPYHFILLVERISTRVGGFHFVDAVLLDREPISRIDLARDVVETIYGAYASAGRKGCESNSKDNLDVALKG
jgi:hypothetical protein